MLRARLLATYQHPMLSELSVVDGVLCLGVSDYKCVHLTTEGSNKQTV